MAWRMLVSLIVSLAQVYALAVGDLDTTLLYRLAENGIGAVIAVIVATVFLPVPTYSVIRTGLHSYLEHNIAHDISISGHARSLGSRAPAWRRLPGGGAVVRERTSRWRPG
jgi:hypothetical protein